jgi:hypothetical protein
MSSPTKNGATLFSLVTVAVDRILTVFSGLLRFFAGISFIFVNNL